MQRYLRYVCLCVLVAMTALQMSAQTGSASTIRGTVSDPSGAVIPGADVVLMRGAEQVRKVSTDEQGRFAISAPPGNYSMRVSSVGFTPYEFRTVNLGSQPMTLDAQLKLASETIQVEVNEQVQGVSTDAAANLGAVVLREEELAALSDNPEDLEQELQALAGPSAGPNGAQFFVDGFSGGRLPPKSAIREIRINQNPYAPEFDRIGFGRIEIFTRPGADKFRGSAYFNFGDESLNARNPYLAQATRPPYQLRLYGVSFGGPLGKKSSFNLEFDRREFDESSLVNATILDANNQITPFSQGVLSPRRIISINPRWDYAINKDNTLIVRYQADFSDDQNNGVNNFSLVSRAYASELQNHTLQVSETAVLNSSMINEARFQYIWQKSSQNDPSANVPSLVVQDAFSAGGSQVGNAYSRDKRFEFQDFISIVKGTHSMKFGGRLRYVDQQDNSPGNFGGTFQFGAVSAPPLDANLNPLPCTAATPTNPSPANGCLQLTSIQAYQRAQQLLAAGFTGADLVSRGAAPRYFSINTGTALLGIDQTDVGLFAQDDWKIRPSLTLSYGIRWEGQNNIGNNSNFAPRFGLAWGVGAKKNQAAKTVIRVNAGVFYDRFNENLVLQARRLNGSIQRSYVVDFPNFYPNVPTIQQIQQIGTLQSQQIRQVDPALQAPYNIQYSFSFERALPMNSTLSVTYLTTRGVHQLRSRNINAPINGVRPYGNELGNIINYESTGFQDQRRILAFVRGGNMNFRSKWSPIKSAMLFGFYSYGINKGDTDGVGSQPANPYDMSTEYGRSAFDIRHSFNLFPNLTLPWNMRMSPIIQYNSGGAYNITTGRDNNGDLQFLDRPGIVTDASRPLCQPGRVVAGCVYQFNGLLLDPNPQPGQEILERNYAQAPTFFTVNMRFSKTFGFGKGEESARGPGGGGMMMGGPMMGGGPRGGMRGGPGGGGMFGMDSTNKRYNLTLSLQVNNLFNTVNPAAPTGNLGSPFFGISTAVNGFGGFGGPRGGGGGGGGFGGAGQAANRTVQLQMRFAF